MSLHILLTIAALNRFCFIAVSPKPAIHLLNPIKYVKRSLYLFPSIRTVRNRIYQPSFHHDAYQKDKLLLTDVMYNFPLFFHFLRNIDFAHISSPWYPYRPSVYPHVALSLFCIPGEIIRLITIQDRYHAAVQYTF